MPQRSEQGGKRVRSQVFDRVCEVVGARGRDLVVDSRY
jgi:hypothetical protein